MKNFAVIILGAVCISPPLTALQQPKQDPTGPAGGVSSACGEKLSASEVQRLERDVAKMRAIVDQMQKNLASATTGETPLKHQFQLDIDMWQLVIAQLESRIEANRPR